MEEKSAGMLFGAAPLRIFLQSCRSDGESHVGDKITGMLVGGAIGCLMVYLFNRDWTDRNSSIIVGFACGALATYMVLKE